MSSGVLTALRLARPKMSFEQHALVCEQTIAMLWMQIQESGLTVREIHEMVFQRPELMSLITAALEQLAVSKTRPLALMHVPQDQPDTYDKLMLVVAVSLVTVHHFPVVVMRNCQGANGLENRLMVVGDPVDFRSY